MNPSKIPNLKYSKNGRRIDINSHFALLQGARKGFINNLFSLNLILNPLYSFIRKHVISNLSRLSPANLFLLFIYALTDHSTYIKVLLPRYPFFFANVTRV